MLRWPGTANAAVVGGSGCRGAHSAAVGGFAAYGCGVPLAGIVRPLYRHPPHRRRTGAYCAPLYLFSRATFDAPMSSRAMSDTPMFSRTMSGGQPCRARRPRRAVSFHWKSPVKRPPSPKPTANPQQKGPLSRPFLLCFTPPRPASRLSSVSGAGRCSGAAACRWPPWPAGPRRRLPPPEAPGRG